MEGIGDGIVRVINLIVSILALGKTWLELKKIKNNLNAIQIVANPIEMRAALKKPLEGKWEVRGEFSCYQGTSKCHFSKGVVLFLWDEERDRYSVTYTYTVYQEYTSESLITAVCNGYAVEESIANSSEKFLELTLKMDDYTRDPGIMPPQKGFFTMKTTSQIAIQKTLRELEFELATPYTEGVIKFMR